MTDAELFAQLKGKFLVVDGADGSGKSLQCARLAATLRHAGHCVTVVREPGGTEYGERIRDLLLHFTPTNPEEAMDPHTELCLFFAARSQLVHQTILPALAKGETVLTDRFVSSTMAYQGSGHGIPQQHIRDLAGILLPAEAWPYCTVILDISTATAAARWSKNPDRIEQYDAEFHQRVRAGYRIQDQRYGHTVVVDANGTPDAVFHNILTGLRDYGHKRLARGLTGGGAYDSV